MKPITPFQFSFFRIVFSTYLLFHFVDLIPYGPEMFSNKGLIPDGYLNPTSSVFPNLLYWLDSPKEITIFISLLALLSLLLLLGVERRIISLLIWYGWACLFNRNIFTGNPGLAYIGWILLAMAFIPKGEPLTWNKKVFSWEFPKEIYWGGWFLISLGYTISGIHKLGSPSWIDGTAIYHVLNNPLARDTQLREWLIQFPEFLKVCTWVSLFLEITYLPFALNRKTRPLIWTAMVGMHLGILITIDFADLTAGVLMFHLFVFDNRWMKPQSVKNNQNPILFFDGICGLCNRFIDFLVAEDQSKILRYSPLQGKTANQQLTAEQLKSLDSLVVHIGQRAYIKSTAVLTLFSYIGGFWKLISIFWIFPRPVRDWIYDLLASHRYKIFGKKETCRLPTPEEKPLFLD